MLRRVRVGAREQEDPVGVVRLAGPDLLTVDHEVVAVPDGARLQRREIGAGAGFAVALAPLHLARRDAVEVLLLLLVAAVDHDRRAEVADRGRC